MRSPSGGRKVSTNIEPALDAGKTMTFQQFSEVVSLVFGKDAYFFSTSMEHVAQFGSFQIEYNSYRDWTFQFHGQDVFTFDSFDQLVDKVAAAI